LHHEEEIPEFILLRYILKLNDSWKLIVQHLETLSFDQTLWSYEIVYLEKFSVMDLDECVNILPHGLDIYFVKKSSFVNILTRLTGKAKIDRKKNDRKKISRRKLSDTNNSRYEN
jgi:hypothetical protein